MMPSYVPLNINMAFTLRFIVAWVPSVSHFLKLALSSRTLTCVHESPFPSDMYFIDVVELADKDSGMLLLTLS